MDKHIVVDWPASMELYLLYENISCGFTSQASRCSTVLARTGSHSKCVGRN